MKKILISIALLAAPLLAIAGISINIGEPDYYGQLQIGNERPQLLYGEPIIIQGGPGRYPPLYLRVPEYQARNWGAYCMRYSACGRPVYFVNDNWYRNTYAPRYRHERHRDRDYGHRHDRHDNGRHHGQDKRSNRDNRGYPADRGVPADRGYPAERGVPATQGYPAQGGVPANRGVPADRGVPAGASNKDNTLLNRFHNAR